MNIPLPEQKGPHLINRWRTVRMAHFSTPRQVVIWAERVWLATISVAHETTNWGW